MRACASSAYRLNRVRHVEVAHFLFRGRVISSYLNGSCYTRGIYPEELTPILPVVVHRSGTPFFVEFVRIFPMFINLCIWCVYIGNITTYLAHGTTAMTTLQAYEAVFSQGDSKEAARWLARAMQALEPLYAVRTTSPSWSAYPDCDCSTPTRAKHGFTSSTGRRRRSTSTWSSGRKSGAY